MAKPLDYTTYVGLYLNRHRAMIQKAYLHTLGMSEFYSEQDMPDEWIDSLSEDEFDAYELRMDINARRAFNREAKSKSW
jgi:hypothetical protein